MQEIKDSPVQEIKDSPVQEIKDSRKSERGYSLQITIVVIQKG